MQEKVLSVILIYNPWLGFSKEPISIVFAGDISFYGPVRYYVQHGYHSYNDTFRRIAPYIREADVAVVNFESPFVTKEMLHQKDKKGSHAIFLNADAESASSLRYGLLKTS